MCVELPHANQAAHLSHALPLRARGASCTPSISKMGCRGKALGTLHTIIIHEVPNGMRGSGSVVPGHDAPGGRRTAAKGIACRYLYKKASITLMEVRPKELANHALLDLAREASIALMEVRPAC